MDLAALRAETEALTTKLQRAEAEAATGHAAVLDLSAFRQHPDVAGLDAVQLAREAQAVATGKGEEKRAKRLGALAGHLFGLAADADARAALVERHGHEATVKISGIEPGEVFAFQTALATLPGVDNRDAREGLESRIVQVSRQIEGYTARTFEAAQELAHKAGFAHLHEAVEHFSAVDLRALVAEAKTFLADTDAMYSDVLAWWLRRTASVKIFPHGAERHDLVHALTLAPFAGLFPHGDIAKTLLAKVPAMGLDPLAGKRIRLDGEARPTKQSRARAWALVVPDEVYVAWRPQGPLADTAGFLRAYGTALHLAHTDPARPFEDRGLGDSTVPEAMGGLFENWLLDRRWLKARLDAEVPDFARVLALVGLARAREQAVRLIYETGLQIDGLTSAQPERFSELFSRAMLARWPPGLWLHGLTPRLAIARDVQALALEAALFETLRDRFDEDWWANPRSGGFLQKLFEQGRFEGGLAVSERLGLGPLALTKTAARFAALLG